MRAALVRPHAGHRLVEQQHARVGGQRHGEFELAVLAVAQLATEHVGARAEADALERRARRRAQLCLAARVAPEAERVAGMRLHGERDVLERGEIRKQRRDLERARQAELAAALHRQRGDVVAAELDAPGVGRDLAGELADQRGLAGAVRADDRRAARRRATSSAIVVGGDDAAEALGQALDPRAARQPRRDPRSRPSMPPRANSTISSSSGPSTICQYSPAARHLETGTAATRSARQRLLQQQQHDRADDGPNSDAHAAEHHHTMRSPERVQCMVAG